MTTDKNYLKKGIKISFETSTVGILHTLEENLGELWGHNKKNLTEDEEYFRSVWDEVRSQIFQKSKKAEQICLSHVDKYSVRKQNKFNNFRDS